MVRLLVPPLMAGLILLGGCDQISPPSSDATAGRPKGVPTQLFEIQLGKVYRMRDQNFTTGDLPMAKFAGAEQALGIGTSVYFQPKKTYDAFPYTEDRKPGQEFFGTSYRTFLLPLIPHGLKTTEELSQQKDMDYEVLLIEWRERLDQTDLADDNKKNERYAWAQSMCKTFEADLGITPKVSEQWVPPGDKSTVLGSTYTCTFVEGSREFEVSSLLGRSVRLAFTNDVIKSKSDEVDKQARKLLAPSVRPY